MIPLYSTFGSLIGHFTEEVLKHMPGVELRLNRRGHIKRARVKPLTCIVELTPDGFAFKQELESGRVWALSGVDGSR